MVTGASSGIGLAITRTFLDCGAKGVIAVFRDGDVPEPGFGECLAKHGGRIGIIRGDVGRESTAVEFTRASLDRFGSLNVLVNNAGVSVVKAIHEHSEEEWDFVMNTDVKALFWAAREVIPVMIRQGGGVILSTGSISGAVGIPTQGAYGPAKGALHQITRQMAVEYARYGIRVNTIACGTVDTAIVQRSAEASGDAAGYWNMLLRAHPIGRIAKPEEVAKFFAYMASDHASFFTGSILMMDGGYTAQ